MEEVGRKNVVTEEPTPLKTLVEVATQMEGVESEVDKFLIITWGTFKKLQNSIKT